MASPLIPHLDWPITIGANGHLKSNEQDSLDDIATCVAISLLTPPGYRDDEPDFGSRLDFPTLPVKLGELTEQLARDEPRASTILVDDPTARADLQLRVQVRIVLARGAS